MPGLLDYPRYALQLVAGNRSHNEKSQNERMRCDLKPYLDINQPLDILDLANGRLRPQYAIMRGIGHRVNGVDFVNRPQTSWKNVSYSVARRIYANRLKLPYSTMCPEQLIVGDVGRLPLGHGLYDLVMSAAAFEHFLDVPSVVAEIYRVLRPGGMVWASIHLFTSPSGGHNLSFTEVPLKTIPNRIEPWDHLRRRTLPFTVPLNEWRKDQYLDAFGRHFEIVKTYCAIREGEQWLTPEVRAALPDYSDDELTCGALVIVARKPPE